MLSYPSLVITTDAFDRGIYCFQLERQLSALPFMLILVPHRDEALLARPKLLLVVIALLPCPFAKDGKGAKLLIRQPDLADVAIDLSCLLLIPAQET